MFRTTITIFIGMLNAVALFAQQEKGGIGDTLQTTALEEIVIISEQAPSAKESKPLSTLDHYLEKASSINMIRRGSYAWEPFINGMASERNVITIDGMRIYGACTDKMDPVTSYVEITNLASANVHSGQSGVTGATIGGSLDLERKKTCFGEKTFRGMALAGFESNNQQKIIGSSLSYATNRFFTDVDFMFRDAENYRAGGDTEILYSQFTKYNLSAMAGYKLGEHQHIEASVIYDHATNVGYPALPMDVALAKAFIGSVAYVQHHLSPVVHQWQTKFYYNDVTHIMDDSHRPVVPIRMDMPGWSKTAGFYSLLEGGIGKHNWKINLSGHHNLSLAEMTMYSNTAGEKDMFMLTWPGIQTNYGDLFAENRYRIAQNWTAHLSAGIAVHNNVVENSLGLESLKIFYPEMKKSNTRLLKRIATSFDYKKKNWATTLGVAYGERAPSVSEGYGFYLFNSFDRFDYIGNPEMDNEKSISLNGAIAYSRPKFSAKFSASHFYISDYIIGRPQSHLSVMTIGASGVKVYEQLNYVHLLNTTLDFDYQITGNIAWVNKLSYRYGTGAGLPKLPLMQPFTFYSDMTYTVKTFSASVSVNGADKQTRFNAEFGEKALPAYAVLNLAVSNRFVFKKQSLLLKAGIENLLDSHYTTFADWNRLPRMGRNIYLNAICNF